ncbi:MAG: surface lipoprotein assembly modifier [Pseudoruegeria sp.]
MSNGYLCAAKSVLVALCLSALPVETAALDIPAENASDSAFLLLQNGYAKQAVELAEAIVLRDSDDIRGYIVLSQARRALGDFDRAIEAGKTAWQKAKKDESRFAAALVTAQAYSSAGKRTRSMLWLRRAAEIAPDEARKAQALRDFRYVRGRNPLATTLSFSVQPSSNVNNGSKSDTLIIDGLPFAISGDARALSGVEYSLGGQTAFTKRLDPRRLIRIGGRFETKHYTLSSEAKEMAPNIDASDLSYTEIELTFGHTWLKGPGNSITDLSFDLGRTWYGGQELSKYFRTTLQHRQKLTKSITGVYSLSGTRQLRDDSSVRNSTEITGRANWVHVRPSGSVLGWSLGVRDTQSDAATISHDAFMVGASVQPKVEIFGTRSVFQLDLEKRIYDKNLYGTLREDDRVRAGVTVIMNRFDYYGFAPTLNMSYSRTQSNISLYDTDDIGVSLGIKSTF